MLNLCAKTQKMNQNKEKQIENGDKFCVQTLFKKVINCNCNLDFVD